MTSRLAHPRGWTALRAFACFFAGGALGSLGYGVFRNHAIGALPWGGLLFGSVVCAAAVALAPGRRRR
ncbi:hypothetical protein SAMN05216223_12556 [Actinacidiphila yanglinensis]|uniref:Uncharacterized protein n=1 Tax=Actinacidiphila yanglinensis TaxID=310779 RepID=A0A1H6E5E7_9ACTN|nr:hypothetical protein [Actinacidiphila yanglinensis]SEG92115.1 hypothetical protein SAMN05216223_12556 [Actinacidiphila yanglinensis]